MAKPNVGILGSGDVAQSLGKGFARHGYEVRLSSRTPDDARFADWKEEAGGKGAVVSFAAAARFGEIVVIALDGDVTEDILVALGAESFSGKIVIDATNPLDFSRGMPPGLYVGTTDSQSERVQKALPGAKVVKCFNTVSHVQTIDPSFKAEVPPMLIAGDDEAAKRRVEDLVKDVGWSGVMDVGGIDGSRWLEALVPLWVRVGSKLNTWGHAFRAVQ